jgi:hypothetical protein
MARSTTFLRPVDLTSFLDFSLVHATSFFDRPPTPPPPRIREPRFRHGWTRHVETTILRPTTTCFGTVVVEMSTILSTDPLFQSASTPRCRARTRTTSPRSSRTSGNPLQRLYRVPDPTNRPKKGSRGDPKSAARACCAARD